MTLPLSTVEVVLGKFLAAWAFVCVAVALTFPVWGTVNYLGAPDNGVVVSSYVGSLLMAGAYLAIGACVSALTRNQVIAFILAALVSFLLLASGLEIVTSFFVGWAPAYVTDTVAAISFLTHFQAIMRGVIDIRDAVYFASLIAIALFINVAIVDMKKAQ